MSIRHSLVDKNGNVCMDKILIIDDESGIRSLLARIIGLEGYEVVQADDCANGLKRAKKEQPDVVLCDVFLPDGNGIDLIPQLKAILPQGEIILLTAHGNIADGVQAIKNGAFDYITKGDDNTKILPLISRAMDEVATHKKEKSATPKSHSTFTFDTIQGSSSAVKQAITMARKAAVTDVAILLTGETGVGKDVFAQSIHNESRRRGEAFMAVNCSAFSKELLESEMFGHRAGAFTGALKDKKGLFEVADKGTIFLDEIGEMALELQAKLLRILESGEYIKIGDTKPTRVNVRVIAATNRDLQEEISHGRFRADLYYRLSVFELHLPSLRERVADIETLADFFINRFSQQQGVGHPKMSAEFVNLLKAYPWPGNIRELRNVIERSMIVGGEEVLEVSDLPLEIQNHASDKSDSTPLNSFELSAMERRHIVRVLQHTGGNKTETARLLKIGLTTLYRKIEEYKI